MPWILKFRMKDDFMFGQQDFIQTFEQKWIEMLSLLETNKLVRVAGGRWGSQTFQSVVWS